MSGSKSVRPPWWLKPANKVFIRMSRLGLSFGGESPVVLTVPGRKSGRERSTPVTPMTSTARSTWWPASPAPTGWPTSAPPARSRWRAAARSDGSEWSSCPLTIPDRCCGLFPEKVPTGVGFMKRAGLVADGRPEEFEALAGRIAVFRLDGIQ